MIARLVVVLASLLTACKLTSFTLTCPEVLEPALAVTVRDSASGTFIASGTSVIAYSTFYSDTVFVPTNRADLDAQPVELAAGHAGTFFVTVDKPGYREWLKTDVVVRSGRCGVETRALTARLQPTP